MNPLTQEYLQEQYKKIRLLKESEKGEVWLVSAPDGELAMLKSIHHAGLPLKQLKEHPSSFWPKILLLHEDKEEDFSLVVEEYIPGQTLETLIEAKKITPAEGAKIFKQFCHGLKELHRLGIIHRDIKPANIIIKETGTPVLIDFDSSRLITDKKDKAADTVLLGTKGYAPPEQFGYAATDIRSDIYALGITFENLLPPSKKFKKILQKCHAFDPNMRYQNVDEILADLAGKRINKILAACVIVLLPICILLLKFSPAAPLPPVLESAVKEIEQAAPAELLAENTESSATTVKSDSAMPVQTAPAAASPASPGTPPAAADSAGKKKRPERWKFNFIEMSTSFEGQEGNVGIPYRVYNHWQKRLTDTQGIYQEITFPDNFIVEVKFTNNSPNLTWENPVVDIEFEGSTGDYDYRETRSLPNIPPGETYIFKYSLAGHKAQIRTNGGDSMDLRFRPRIKETDVIKQVQTTAFFTIGFVKP